MFASNNARPQRYFSKFPQIFLVHCHWKLELAVGQLGVQEQLENALVLALLALEEPLMALLALEEPLLALLARQSQ